MVFGLFKNYPTCLAKILCAVALNTGSLPWGLRGPGTVPTIRGCFCFLIYALCCKNIQTKLYWLWKSVVKYENNHSF